MAFLIYAVGISALADFANSAQEIILIQVEGSIVMITETLKHMMPIIVETINSKDILRIETNLVYVAKNFFNKMNNRVPKQEVSVIKKKLMKYATIHIKRIELS